jgi:hypothetical protein
MAMIRRLVRLGCLALALLPLAACGAAAGRPPAATGSAASPAAVEESHDPHAFRPPQGQPALHTLAQVPARQGDAVAGSFDAVPGELWISVTCLGGGDLTVTFEPLDRFDLPCTGELLDTRNQINLTAPHHMRVTVSAPPAVRWALLVQQ